jgi:hypothetical protein
MKLHTESIHYILSRTQVLYYATATDTQKYIYVRIGQSYSQRIVVPKLVRYSEAILSHSQLQVPNPGYQIPSIFKG